MGTCPPCTSQVVVPHKGLKGYGVSMTDNYIEIVRRRYTVNQLIAGNEEGTCTYLREWSGIQL